MPKTAEKPTVKQFKAMLTPVNFRVKYKISKSEIPIKAFKIKNLIGVLLITDIIKSVKPKTQSKTIIPYFKNNIKSPNIILMLKW